MKASRLNTQCRAFTLVELITVITIILLLVGVMLPTISNLMRGNSQKQAVNTISAYLASARATAVTTKTPVAVIFYEDQANGNATAVSLAIQDQTVAAFTLKPFSTTVTTNGTSVINARVEYLPLGMKVAAIDGNGLNLDAESTISGFPRIVMFDANGQLMLRGNISINPQVWDPNAGPTHTGAMVTIWQPPAGIANMLTASTFVSTPAVVVYNSNDLKAYIQANPSATATSWLTRYADTIVINSYTGNVIR